MSDETRTTGGHRRGTPATPADLAAARAAETEAATAQGEHSAHFKAAHRNRQRIERALSREEHAAAVRKRLGAMTAAQIVDESMRS